VHRKKLARGTRAFGDLNAGGCGPIDYPKRHVTRNVLVPPPADLKLYRCRSLCRFFCADGRKFWLFFVGAIKAEPATPAVLKQRPSRQRRRLTQAGTMEALQIVFPLAWVSDRNLFSNPV
jgi:hypothetical protein